MPEQISSKPNREAVDAYHRAMRHVIEIIHSWDRNNLELQEFLDYDKNLILEPKEYRRFRKVWELTIARGKKARVFQRPLQDHALKVVAKEIWSSEARMRFYSRLLNERLRCMSASVDPISIVELEQRYQYHLYRKGRQHQGLTPGPVFEIWCHTPDRVTFFDALPL